MKPTKEYYTSEGSLRGDAINLAIEAIKKDNTLDFTETTQSIYNFLKKGIETDKQQ